jgi:hypothetical protein
MLMFRDLLSAFGLGQKKINNILNQDEEAGTTSRLDSLLAEDETLQECKSQNPRLIEFLSKRENLIKLIKYATRIPEDIEDNTIAHK